MPERLPRLRPLLVLLVLGGLVALLTLGLPERAPPPLASLPVPGLGRVPPERQVESEGATVIDGDTLRLADGTEVRIVGIDTPEVDRPFHREAGEALAAWCKSRRILIVPPRGGSHDRHGRLLGAVFVASDGDRADWHDIGLGLIERGLAIVYTVGEDPLGDSRRQRLVEAQRRALEAGRGLWTGGHRLRAGGDLRATRHRFHRSGCRHLRAARRAEPVERLAAYRRGLSPCRTCRPE